MRNDIKKGISISEALTMLNEDVSKMSWEDIQNKIALEKHAGINPLYEDSAAGDYIYQLMGKVETDLGLEVLPSVQGGYGDVYIHAGDPKPNSIGPINFTDFCNEVIDLVLEASTEEEFINNYRENILAYLG